MINTVVVALRWGGFWLYWKCCISQNCTGNFASEAKLSWYATEFLFSFVQKVIYLDISCQFYQQIITLASPCFWKTYNSWVILDRRWITSRFDRCSRSSQQTHPLTTYLDTNTRPCVFVSALFLFPFLIFVWQVWTDNSNAFLSCRMSELTV